jgi:hypothetical protein
VLREHGAPLARDRHRVHANRRDYLDRRSHRLGLVNARCDQTEGGAENNFHCRQPDHLSIECAPDGYTKPQLNMLETRKSPGDPSIHTPSQSSQVNLGEEHVV